MVTIRGGAFLAYPSVLFFYFHFHFILLQNNLNFVISFYYKLDFIVINLLYRSFANSSQVNRLNIIIIRLHHDYLEIGYMWHKK